MDQRNTHVNWTSPPFYLHKDFNEHLIGKHRLPTYHHWWAFDLMDIIVADFNQLCKSYSIN